jgi:ubiquinone biosynthesis protein
MPVELKTFTNIARAKDVAVVLAKHGFEDVVQRMELPGWELVKKISPAKDPEIDLYQRIRLAMEELGPTFVKLGQILSLRPDLLPLELIKELSRLQDNVSTLPFETIKKVLEEEFNAPLETVFNDFEETPLASASLSQVHRAVHIESGTALAVKVRRPDITRLVETDLDILHSISRQLHNSFEQLQIYDLPAIVETNRRTLLREIDFSKEARYIQIARSKNDPDSGVVIPDVFMSYCTSRVLVTEFISGQKIDPDLRLSRRRRKTLAESGIRSAILQILEHGFYHADPHPGNILITEDYQLCLMDWGMVGRLTPGEREQLLFLIQAAVDRDSGRIVKMVLDISDSHDTTINKQQLEKDLIDMMDVYFSIPLKAIQIDGLLESFTQVLQSHQLRLPSDISIIIKALITVEGTARMIYPDLDIISEARPHIRRLFSQQYSPRILWGKFQNAVSGIWTLQRSIPASLSNIVQKMEQGKLTIRFEHKNLTEFKNSLESSFNRLTLGVVLSALIIGSSMIITTGVSPFIFGYPALGIIGYIVSGVIALWLIVTIIRRRNL